MLSEKFSITRTLILLPVVFLVFNFDNAQSQKSESESVIDSDLNFEEAVAGISVPDGTIENLRIVDIYYYGFDDKLHKGQLVVHKDVVLDIIEIFEFIRESHFPVEKVIPISQYNWSDEKSMKDNNTSAFNYRFISGTRVISNHASGLAIDINPRLNPYIKNGSSLPANCIYDTTKTGTISASSQLVNEFKQRGWQWGGDWKSLKDYQHFEKKLK
ncbi:MAG: M15 family metallopeptidase [Ignavibacteriales bacterium]|nr:M15 family metallopeptidase [Ignavibacteriales bacterium]